VKAAIALMLLVVLPASAAADGAPDAAFNQGRVAKGSSIVRVVAVDRAGNRSAVAVHRVTR
jgi:hypothetical protein